MALLKNSESELMSLLPSSNENKNKSRSTTGTSTNDNEDDTVKIQRTRLQNTGKSGFCFFFDRPIFFYRIYTIRYLYFHPNNK
jgi:hypothetical protein